MPDGDAPGEAPLAPAFPAGASATAAAAPTWVRHSTAAPAHPAPPLLASPAPTPAPPPAASAPVAALVAAETPPTEALAALPDPEALPPAPTISSPDGRLTLTDTSLTVLGQTFGLRELERAEVQPVRWLFWYLLGALGVAIVLILFLTNGLRTLPAMTGLLAAALLLLYGHRGTNRLRLWLLGREAVHFALPGDADGWRRLVGELNRRVHRAHDQAAAEAARLLAALEAERNAALAAAMQAEATPYHPDPAISDAPA